MKTYETDLADSRHHTAIRIEMDKAINKFPKWPNDPFHALAIVQEEVGELAKAILQYHYEQDKNVSRDDIVKEAVQSICMLHRFLNSFEQSRYDWPDTRQHEYSM